MSKLRNVKLVVFAAIVLNILWLSYCVAVLNGYNKVTVATAEQLIELKDRVRKLEVEAKLQLQLNHKILMLEAKRQGMEKEAQRMLDGDVEAEQKAYEARRAARQKSSSP